MIVKQGARASLLPVLGVFAIVLAACTGAAATAAPTAAPVVTAAPTAAPTPAPTAAPPASTGDVLPGDTRFEAGKPGGTVTVAYVGPCCVGVDNNNPMDQGGDYEWTHLIYEHLNTNAVNPVTVDKNPFGGLYGGLVPELADSWEVSADHLTWTFKLHPGVTWHDGTAFTADDVKFSFELCLDPKIGTPCYPGGSLHGIVGAEDVIAGKATDLTGVKVVDPTTVAITTVTPNALLPFNVQDLFIVQKASVGKIPRDQIGKNPYWSTPGQVVGTGPFKVTAYAAGQSMEVSRNDSYWRSKPFLDKIVRREFKDISSALIAFEAGEVDVTYITADDVEKELQSTVGTVLPGPSGVDLDITCNPKTLPDCEKKEVRQAIKWAIDRISILKNVYHIPDPKNDLNCLYLNPAYNPADVADYGFDPQKAKDLLAAAGVDPSKWGEVVFDTYYQDPGSKAAMEAIQANLADIGITLKIQQMDSASWSDRFYGKGTAAGQSQLSLIGGDGGGAANGYGYGTLHSTSAYPKGGNGWNGWKWVTPGMDEALDAVKGEFDPEKRVLAIQNVCKIDAEFQPYIQMWATTRYWMINNRVGNFVSTPGPGMGNYYKAAEMWYIR